MAFLDLIITTYMALLGLRLLLPSSSPFSDNLLQRGLYAITEPLLRPVRQLFIRGEPRIDWSPLIIILMLVVARGALMATLSGAPPSVGVAQSVYDVVDFLVIALAILFLGVFFISIDTPFGYSQIGHIMYTLADPFLNPLRWITGRARRGPDMAALLGIVVAGALGGLASYQLEGMTQGAYPASVTTPVAMSLVHLLDVLLDMLFIIILFRAILSWFHPDPASPLFQLVILYSDPVLAPIQRIMPSTYGIDFSPLIAILILRFVQSSVLPFLLQM
jgi:YggT family protein